MAVEDITNAGLFKREKEKAMKQDRKRNQKELRKKLYIPMTKDDDLETFSSLSFQVDYNPDGDGNCQFEALRFWLQTLGIYLSVQASPIPHSEPRQCIWHSISKFCRNAM